MSSTPELCSFPSGSASVGTSGAPDPQPCPRPRESSRRWSAALQPHVPSTPAATAPAALSPAGGTKRS